MSVRDLLCALAAAVAAAAVSGAGVSMTRRMAAAWTVSRHYDDPGTPVTTAMSVLGWLTGASLTVGAVVAAVGAVLVLTASPYRLRTCAVSAAVLPLLAMGLVPVAVAMDDWAGPGSTAVWSSPSTMVAAAAALTVLLVRVRVVVRPT